MKRLTTAYERIWADGSAEMQYVANTSDLEVVNRLGTYEDAEEEGRLFVVPCKPGDEIYEIVVDEIPVWNCYVHRFIVQDVSAKQVKYSDDWADWDTPYLYTDEKEAEAKARQLRNQRKRLESGWIPVTERLPENGDYVLHGIWGIASTKIPVWQMTCSSMPGCRCQNHTGRMKKMGNDKNCNTCRYHSENGTCRCTRSEEFSDVTTGTYCCDCYQLKMEYDWRMSVLDRFMRGAGR